MRDLRFRAWNTEFNRMTLPESLFLDAYYGSEHGCLINEFFNKPNMIFMPYTEIDDSKKQPIYDSDLVEDSQGLVWRVIFSEGCYKALCGPRWKYLHNMYCTVIGNFYQHKELLYKKPIKKEK